MGQSRVLKTDTPYCFPYILDLPLLYRTGFELETGVWTLPSKSIISQASKKFKARKIMHRLWVSDFIILRSWNRMTHIVLLIHRLPDKNIFVLQTDLGGIPPFK